MGTIPNQINPTAKPSSLSMLFADSSEAIKTFYLNKLLPYSLEKCQQLWQAEVKQNKDPQRKCIFLQVANDLAKRFGNGEKDSKALQQMALIDEVRCPANAVLHRQCVRQIDSDSFECVPNKLTLKKDSPKLVAAKEELTEVIRRYQRNNNLLQAFYNGTEGGVLSLSALGKLNETEVKNVFQKMENLSVSSQAGTTSSKTTADPLVDRLKFISFKAMCNTVASYVQGDIKKAEQQIQTLLAQPDKRAAFFNQLPEGKGKYQQLRKLGFNHQTANTLAQEKQYNDGLFVSGLKKASSALEDLNTYTIKNELEEAVAYSLFNSFVLVVNTVQSDLGIEPGSFADMAINAGLKQGKKDVQIDQLMKMSAGIISGLVVNTVTPGLGMGAKIGIKLIKPAVFGGKEMLEANTEIQRTDIGEGMGFAPPGTNEKAIEKQKRTLIKNVIKAAAGYAKDIPLRP